VLVPFCTLTIVLSGIMLAGLGTMRATLDATTS